MPRGLVKTEEQAIFIQVSINSGIEMPRGALVSLQATSLSLPVSINSGIEMPRGKEFDFRC